ncbi:hypothetical protein, partial [Zhenhengia sp.]|uniref:hypothetical protein n=1 Tax=Zhenhengia sp. TaxID=2944208 RepID=UPI00307A0525
CPHSIIIESIYRDFFTDPLQTECHISVELIPSADAEEYRKSCSPQKTAMINSLIVGHVIPTEEL